MLDIGSSNHGNRALVPHLLLPPWPRALKGGHMQSGEEFRVDEAISEIAALLATAYQRRASPRFVHTPPEPLPTTEELAIPGERSVHGLTLTRRRED